MSVIGIGDVIKICELSGRVYRNCMLLTAGMMPLTNHLPGRDCTGEYKSLTSEARSLTNLLEDINDKFEKIPASKRKQLQDAYEPCIDVLQELDKLLEHYNKLDTRTKRTWDRITYDPEKTRTLRDRLTSSVVMLNGFYTSLIHDSQVLILDALEKLERDYRGGHREESIASLERITSGTVEDEDEQDEAAWTQILRDLEDVGVAKQDALSYRDVIVDWLVTAVNEGRLLEERQDPDGLQSMPQDLGAALPWENVVDLPGTHHLDVPGVVPSYERSHSVPFRAPFPMGAPSETHHQRAYSIPSTAAPSVPELSGMSSYAASNHTEDTDTSSLYASPEPVSRVTSGNYPSTTPIRRVPVPTRYAEPLHTTAPSEGFETATSPSAPASTSVFTSVSGSGSGSVPALDPSTSLFSPPPARAPPQIPPKTPVPPAIAFSQFPEVYTPQSSSAVFHTVPALSTSASFSREPITSAPPAPPLHAYTQPSSAPPLLQTPPSYYDKASTETADLAWTSQQIIAAWSRKDFSAASKHLEDQLAAVERGHTVISTGLQPDRRVLRHLLGVANSFAGNFEKAKRYFESVFNSIHLNRANMDDGDIAAARWLGDVCLHLREHSNALLAWAVAHEGSIGRYGIIRDRTQRIGDELRLLDHWLFVIRRIEHSFHNNVDPTDIFRRTHAVEKSNLIAFLKVHLYETKAFQQSNITRPPIAGIAPHYAIIRVRPPLEMGVSEGFLLAPLISLNAWPLPWDATFSALDAVQLDRNMNTVRIATTITPLVERTLPSTSLGASKNLHYVTKRGSQWLIETVKRGLQELCIEHAEHATETSIVCTLNQHRAGLAFSEGIKISFKKLQFRSVHGMQVSEVLWSTRRTANLAQSTDTKDFRDILKSVLESAENEAASLQTMHYASMAALPHFDNYR
jgi:hypothetical protein